MMTQKISVCIFPETVPGDEILFPLVQVFSPVVYCQAVEDDQMPTELASSLIEILSEKKLSRILVPSRLGEDRDRFLALIAELKDRRDDFAAQLKALSLTGIGGSRLKRESKHSIIENLLQQTGVAREKQEAQSMVLWQARFLLKLGEIFDAEQVGLQRELERIDGMEKGLLDALRKEQEQTFSLTKTIRSVSSRADGLQRLRLKAWSRLFFLGADQKARPGCFVSTNEDGVDLLREEYERVCHTDPQPVLDLPLPARPGKRDVWENLQALQETELFHLFEGILSDPAGKSRGQWNDGQWSRLLEEIYPENECGRSRLHLWFCSDIEPRTLFMEAFGRDEDQKDVQPESAGNGGFLIGWLEC